VKHGRVRGVAIDAVGTPRRDHADFRHGAGKQLCATASGTLRGAVPLDMLHCVADLHRAGVRAQQMGRIFSAAFDVKSVVHGARRMVLRRVQCSEIEPVGFDLGPVGHVEAHGAENGLDALQRK